jgi:hypothetical protein
MQREQYGRFMMKLGMMFLVGVCAAIFGCLTGCQSTGKLSPEQVQSIREVSLVMAQTAQQTGVKAYGYIELEPVYGEIYEGFRLGGVRARVFIYADPTAGTQVPMP